MPLTITLTVTAQHIAKAREARGGLPSVTCPIALALRGFYPTKWVEVGATLAIIRAPFSHSPIEAAFAVSDEAREFIKRFDHGEKVKPDTFELVGMSDAAIQASTVR